jgi:WD40 repeat protein
MKSPFKFLDSYTKDDREIFFGRDREIEELYHRVFESKLMLVYGVSGTGKSSLIHCGLANKFQETDWLPLVIRRGGNIINSMAGAIQSASITKQEGQLISPASFRKSLKSLYLDHYKPVYFIFDQFEELFIFGDKEERKSFVQIIKTLVESDLQCRLIFVMREEYMAGVTEFEKYIPTFFANRVRIEKMSHVNAIEAIDGPCKAAEISLEEGFSEALLERLSPEAADVELTYLQVFLDRIFRLASGFLPPPGGESKGGSLITGTESNRRLTFTLNLLHNAGNVSDLLGSFLEEQISLLSDPDSALAVLKSFVSVKGTKRQMTSEEVKEYAQTLGKPIEDTALIEMLQTFVHLRILRDKDENERFELRHDALAAKIYEKITLVEKELLAIRQFVENAYENFEKRNIYLSSDDLKYIAPYIDKLFVSRKLSTFIENSWKNISAKKRAFKRVLSYSSIGFLIILISVSLYYFRYNISAKSEELTIESFLQKDFSPYLSFKTALEAYSKDTTSTIAIKAMFDSFYELLDNGPYIDSLNNEVNPKKLIFDFTPCSSDILYARFSKDGKYIYGYLEDNTINIWEVNGKLIFSKKEHLKPIVALNFSADNEHIAALYSDSTAIVWNTKGKIILETKVVFDPVSPLDVISFSPSQHLLIYLQGRNKIVVFNTDDSSKFELSGHTGEINGAVFSPDGKYIASASKDSSVIIWIYNDSTASFRMANRLRDYKDIVWSVDFSQTSKYVLCVTHSLPYPISVKRLTGEDPNRMQWFIDEIKDSSYIRKYPWAPYYGRYYSAKFTAGDAAVRISTFNDSFSNSDRHLMKDSSTYKGFDFHRIIYSDQSLFVLNSQNKYLFNYGIYKGNVEDPVKTFDYYYSYVDVSAKYVAACVSGKDYSILYYQDKLPIMILDGIQPVFSNKGNLLLCLKGKILKLYPADEQELVNLATKRLIFGDPDKIPIEWKHFFKDG